MIYYSNLNSKQIKLRIFLLLVFLLFPKGIGIIVPNLAVFDINKSAYLLLVFIVILNIFNKHKHSFFLNHIDLFVLLIIVYSASTFFFWINFNQIIEYMYFLIFGVFAYLLAKNLFQNEFIFMFFINTFYKYLFFTSLFG